MLTGLDGCTVVDVDELLRNNSVSRFASGKSLYSLLIRRVKWVEGPVADLRRQKEELHFMVGCPVT